MRLDQMRVGQIAVVISVSGGYVMRNEMTEKGIYPGVELEMLDNDSDPMSIRLGEAQMKIGKAQARKIRIGSI